MKKVKISDIKLNPNNPRLIKDDKFTKIFQSHSQQVLVHLTDIGKKPMSGI